MGLALSVPLFSALFEALKVVVVFLLGLGLSTVRRAPVKALMAAAFYSAIPATFLLQQWGNWPTLLSLWLVTVWAALVALFWGKLTTWPVLLATTVVLALTMLSYTVTAAYTGLFVGLLVVAGWLFAPRQRNKWGAILLSLVVATGVAVLVFYGQYMGLMLQETLPTFGKAIDEQGSLTTLRPTFGAFISGTILKAMQSYNLAMVYVVGFAGALWVLLKEVLAPVLPTLPQAQANARLHMASWRIRRPEHAPPGVGARSGWGRGC